MQEFIEQLTEIETEFMAEVDNTGYRYDDNSYSISIGYCMKLVEFLNEEAEMGTERYAALWEQRFDQAKVGDCAYREHCPIYARTPKRPRQLSLF